MKQMSITEVKDNFDDVITWIESGKEKQIIVTKYEKPIVRMVPYTCNVFTLNLSIKLIIFYCIS